MSLEAALRGRARAATEGRMTDACTVRRQTGTSYDDDLGTTVPTWSAALYAGPCRMKQPAASASSANVGEASVLIQRPQLHLPMSAPLMRPDDEITITSSEGDPESVGRVFLIREVPAHSDASARRYGVIERTS